MGTCWLIASFCLRNASCCHKTYVSRCFGTASFLQSRLKTVRERATQQHVDWIRSVEATGSAISHTQVSPSASYLEKCRYPFDTDQRVDADETDSATDHKFIDVPDGYAGALKELEIDGFGKISAEHNDILSLDADCVVVPVPPNLTPYSGIGLRVLERGGKKLITALVKRAKVVVAERLAALETMRKHFKDANEYEEALNNAKSLNIGDVILTPPFDAARATIIGFVVTPFFWESGTRNALLKLRHTFKTTLEYLNRMRIRTVLCPPLADALNDCEIRNGNHAVVEEAYDVMAQLDSVNPLYHIQHVRLVHKHLSEARKMADALVEVAHVRRPEFQVQPAAVHFSRASQRVIEFDESVLKFCSHYRKLTYKRHSVVRKSKRMHWLRNIKPFVWRGGPLNSPPPLLLYKATGLPAASQLRPRPFYKDRLSHELFPLMRGPIKGLRVGRSGRWLGKTKQDPIYIQTKSL
ncbi:uncharacterized protein BcabD6B2_45530 [Babesia caballi]|uniref:Macro domain-containing protein n=1 Tax=Babesia caballi TaxID=5871 RepID=A0AAV4LZG9_BABCB|nr:hypothetical protein BcabD6B2_45530 [Babesia caballi]